MAHQDSRFRGVGRGGFTLIELLVVIGIIAILISVLLPVLSSARKSADKTKCLAAMHQLGDAYKLYQVDNRGAWPVAAHFWTSGGVQRDKRWHDFIAKYVIGTQRVTDSSGKVYSDNQMNFNGSNSSTTFGSIAAYATHGEFGTAEDPIWIGTMRDRSSILWGCPSWNRFGYVGQYQYGVNNGYTMNMYPMAPNDLNASKSQVDQKYVARLCEAGSNAGGPNGQYFKMTQWSRPGERALLYDGIFNAGYQNGAWEIGKRTTLQDGSSFDPLDSSATLPKFPDYTVPLDWNRHGNSKPGKVKNSEPSLNMLFCDGHAGTVSAREAFKAIRFQ